MSLSTNELFHFTKFDNLKGILKSKAFFPRYSLEFTYLSKNFNRQASLLPVAMSCFCDIPFDLSENHREKYGNHAIVMSESWKLSSKLNPVMYLQSNSNIADVLADFTNSVVNFGPKMLDENNSIEIVKTLGMVARSLTRIQYFFKQFENKEETTVEYAGKIRKFEKRKFYDEREWRYVPFPDDFFVLPLGISDYDDPDSLRKANKKLEQYPLSFNFKDIKYLIVNDIHEMNEIEKIVGKNNLSIKVLNK